MTQTQWRAERAVTAYSLLALCAFFVVCSSGFFILGGSGLGFLLFYFAEIDSV